MHRHLLFCLALLLIGLPTRAQFGGIPGLGGGNGKETISAETLAQLRAAALKSAGFTGKAVVNAYQAAGQAQKAERVGKILDSLKNASASGKQADLVTALTELGEAKTELAAVDWANLNVAAEGKTMLNGAIRHFGAATLSNNEALALAKPLIDALPNAIKQEPLKAAAYAKDLQLAKLIASQNSEGAKTTSSLLAGLTTAAKNNGLTLPTPAEIGALFGKGKPE